MHKINNLINKYQKFIKHSLASGADTIINLGIYFCLVYFGMYYLFSNFIAYFVSLTIHYFINMLWVFKPTTKSNKKLIFVKFLIVNIFGFLLSEGLLYLFVDILLFNKYLSAIYVLPILTIESYLLFNYWVFKDKRLKDLTNL